jgi:hypothetical protein
MISLSVHTVRTFTDANFPIFEHHYVANEADSTIMFPSNNSNTMAIHITKKGDIWSSVVQFRPRPGRVSNPVYRRYAYGKLELVK